MPANRKRIETLVYVLVVIVSLLALGLFFVVPGHMMSTKPVYQRF